MKHLVCVYLLLTVALPGFSDEILLSNGDILHGTIIAIDEKKVVLKTDYGKLEIARDKIQSGTISGTGMTDSAESSTAAPSASSTGTAPVTIISGLILEMLFDNKFGSSVNNTFSLENKNSVEFTYGHDKMASSAIFSDGTGQYLALSNVKTIDASKTLTISFWAFVNDSSRLQYFISKWTSTESQKAQGKFAVSTAMGSVFFYIVGENGNHYSVSAVNALPARTWAHLAFTFSNGRLFVYVNGELKMQNTAATVALAADTSPLYLLTAKANTSEPFAYYNLNGAIDDLRVFNRALSGEEIKLLMEQ
ncbi:MAG: hypothetical protein JW904_00545 [Spirochaetales bacterium]|nr:hypothetical protein [Spirochaetales bacterium]